MRTLGTQRFERFGKGPKSGYRRITSQGGAILALILVIFLATPVSAEEEPGSADPFARFASFTEGSERFVDHRVWNTVLEAAVVVIRPSTRRVSSSKSRPRSGTRVSRGSRPVAVIESNRVVFHLLSKAHVELVAKYRRELEILPNYYPLADLDKNEQLAYWFNLHNAALFEQLAHRYPISKLKTLRNGKKNKPSLWDEKLLTVEGVALSLNDIQNNILIRHWNSPMVLYGLYQGAIGGPSLSNKAFSGENVHGLLSSTAAEFVNSKRGLKTWRGGASVSLLYEWCKAAFPDWESDLASHLVQIATGSRKTGLTSSEGFTAKRYDWNIADISGNLSTKRTLATAAEMVSGSGIGAPIKSGAPQEPGDLNRNNLIVPGAYDDATVTLLRDAVNQE